MAVKLVDYYYKKTGTPLEAISRAMLRIRGSYAFGVIFKDYPGKLFAARKDSPLIIGKSENGSLIASDVPAILDQTRRVYYIGNLEIAELSRDAVSLFHDFVTVETVLPTLFPAGSVTGFQFFRALKSDSDFIAVFRYRLRCFVVNSSFAFGKYIKMIERF